ncbi:MAG: ABC transporter ATP-binding protein [Gemmataceae bacterium]|jgi:lipopolysaccharide transport system ATP-binding protein|nr:ABC transporter ATP-binding protein [Gemmataceae bacterium]
MKNAIQAQNLSKFYQLGQQRLTRTNLTDALIGYANKLKKKLFAKPEDHHGFWALKDVSFELPKGQVLGLVGRNGAGKSTLLKVLSRIVEPTYGRAEIRGRLGSLLEVGTGFHPELTGRENIFLNGSILGMTRREIKAKFDEIVEFAEIAAFLDTQVKRYSSGMFVRLAFAIAAHLQPEILIVDEILAVGDAKFQKKCLGKMKDVSSEGRTIVFVSHDMTAIRRLCTSGLLLSQGKVLLQGNVDEVVTRYLATEVQLAPLGEEFPIQSVHRKGSGEARFERIAISGSPQGNRTALRSGNPLRVDLTIRSDSPKVAESLIVTLSEPSGNLLLKADTVALDQPVELRSGENQFTVNIHNVALKPGIYTLGLILAKQLGIVYDEIESVCDLEVLPPETETQVGLDTMGPVYSPFDILSR